MSACYICGIEPINVWRRGLSLILERGTIVKDERGSKTKEILNLMSRVENPFGEYPKMRERMLEAYADTLLTIENKGFTYTYGERLGDQIKLIIERLKSNKNTRRATATTWIPSIDLNSEEVPCMILIDFKLREQLELTAVFRSHDFYGAYPYNLYALSKLLKYVANAIDVETGSITILSISAHIYMTDYESVMRCL